MEQLPAPLSLGCVALLAGSLRLRETARQQGGAPWDWSAFRTPAALFLASATAAGPALAAPASLPEAEIERRR